MRARLKIGEQREHDGNVVSFATSSVPDFCCESGKEGFVASSVQMSLC